MVNRNQKILCDVVSCKYNEQVDRICGLNQIMVTEQKEAKKKQDTVCDSFKKLE